ncbi:MAG: SDR family oxidoreductase, partial [Planctomycetes bacterium]|nr:SDR family oxidoreductase [Planctomycetota bacterium]
MKVLVTGHHGYIGSVLVPILSQAGHEVHGLDSGLFSAHCLGPEPDSIPEMLIDVRDVQASDFRGFDAVMHLAGISNDPLGDLNPDCTYEINHQASVRLARLAKEAGVPRFLFASSCSLYGAASEHEILDESAPFRPVTPYAESKILVERDVAEFADDHFSPTFLRCATAYGASPRLRADLVVNNLTGYAQLKGSVLLKSDGTPWRPLVHIADISAAYLAILEAPRQLIHNQAFNVGRSSENYRVRQVAEIVRNCVPGSQVEFAEGAGPDKRCYRVDFSRIEKSLPGYRPTWTVEAGVVELRDSYQTHNLQLAAFDGPEFQRIRCIRAMQE